MLRPYLAREKSTSKGLVPYWAVSHGLAVRACHLVRPHRLRQHPYLRLIRSIVADDASGATLGARKACRKVGRLGVFPNGKRCT